MGKIIKIEDLRKKLLTGESKACYGGILKTANTDSAPVNGVFLYAFMADENGKYIEYPSKPLFAAFSESATSHFCVAHLKKANKMKKINNQEIRNQYKNELSTLQMLWKQYMEIKVNWYKGQYTMEQEEVFGEVFNALQTAIAKLPISCPEDKAVKINMLREHIAFGMEDADGNYDLDKGDGCEQEALSIINQLLAA